MNLRKILDFSVGPIGGAILGLVTLPIIAWFFSAEDIGRIAMLQVSSSLGILLFSLGLDQAYVREYHESNNKPALIKAAVLPGLLLISASLLIALIFPTLISNVIFSLDSFVLSVLIAVYLVSAFISRYLSLMLRMQERGLAFSMSQILPKVLLLLVIGGYILGSFENDVHNLLVAHVLSILVVALICAFNVRKELWHSLVSRMDLQQLHSMIRFGAPLIVGGLAFWGMTAMDRIFLRSLSSFQELGIYSVAASFAAVGLVFQSIFSTVWAPVVYRWTAEGEGNAVESVDKITDLVVIAVSVVFCVSGIFSWVVDFFLPESYSDVKFILMSCMAYPLFYTVSEAASVGLGISRKSVFAMLAGLIACLVNFVANYFLVPKYGAAGAAISSAIAFWVLLFCKVEFACFVWRRIPRLRLYSTTLICLVMVVSFTLRGGDYHFEFVIAWFILLCIFVLLFRSQIGLAVAWLRIRSSGDVKGL